MVCEGVYDSTTFRVQEKEKTVNALSKRLGYTMCVNQRLSLSL